MSFRYRDGHQDNGVPVDEAIERVVDGRRVARAGLSHVRAATRAARARSSTAPTACWSTGAPPGGRGRHRGVARAAAGTRGRAAGEYVADRDGEVDTARGRQLRRQLPRASTRSGCSGARRSAELLRLGRAAPDAGDAAGDVRRADRRRRRTRGPSSADGVTEHVVAEAGVVGRLFLPAGRGEPGVVIARRARTAGRAARWSARCSPGTACPRCRWPTGATPALPDALRDIDVEVVGPGCDWLRAQAGRRRRAAACSACPGAASWRCWPRSLTARAGRPGRLVSSAAGCPGARWGPGTDVLETAWRFGGEPVPQMVRGRGRPRRLPRRRGHGRGRRDPDRARHRPGAAAQRGGRRHVAAAPGSAGSPRRAPTVRARATGSPTSPTPTPGTSARRRPASRSTSPGRRSATAAAGRATRPPGWTRGDGCSSSWEPPDERAARTASASPTASSGCGRRTGWPTSAARTSRPTARRGSARSAGSRRSTTTTGWSCTAGELAYAVLNLYPYAPGPPDGLPLPAHRRLHRDHRRGGGRDRRR